LGRRAVAATLVSFLVFTSMVLANSAVYSSQNNSLRAAIVSAEQAREHSFAGVIVGASTLESLARAQDYLGSNPLDCSSSGQYLDSMSGSLSSTGSDQGVSYSVESSWAYSSAPSGGEGSSFLPLLSGFDVQGLNLEVTVTLNESYSGGPPTYSTQATESMHLPVPIGSIVGDCTTALADLGGSLTSLSYCNSTGVSSALTAAESEYPLLSGYNVTATATASGTGCAVSYQVAATVGGLEGAVGEFQLTLQGEGGLVT
jgi:hypothetical protein